MKPSRFAFLALLAVFVLAAQLETVRAAISWSGDVDPTDPTTWTLSTYGWIGKSYDGTLNISDGGTVSSHYGCIGEKFGSTGEVTVSGSSSTWTNGKKLHIGVYGNGTLAISDGGAVSNGYSYIGDRSGSKGKVTVSGAGSTWINDGRLRVGNYGSGVLVIGNGGFVSSNYGWISDRSGSTGEVTVSGIGSTWTNSGWIAIGLEGNGALTISDCGSVSNDDGYIGFIGGVSGSTGEVTVSGAGSTWTNSNHLYVGRYGDGTLAICDGGLVCVGGVLTIDSNGDGDSFINMYSGGMLALKGEADGAISDFLDLIEGTDAIRYWDDSISAWADITGATYDEDYTLSYLTEGDLAGYTLLTVDCAMGGDANGDGMVDVSDLGILATNYDAGSGFGWGDGDFNGDGFVDVYDLGVLATEYNNSIEATTSQAVPEPSTLSGLLVLCLAGLLVSVRRKR